jgi:hypothetical protein
MAAQVAELRQDIDFVVLAGQLRPRLGGVVNWEAQADVVKLAQKFMNLKSNRQEGVLGPLLIRLLATFERYLRQLVMQIITQRTSAANSYDSLAPSLANRNRVLTGRLLAALDSPRDHLKIDPDLLIQNLATCKPSSRSFRLNAEAFCAGIAGVSPANVEKALENVEFSGLWDAVGAFPALARVLGTKGARATGNRASERLHELSRWRNHLAHGGDGEIAISEMDLRDAVDFIEHFGNALDAAVRKHMKAGPN